MNIKLQVEAVISKRWDALKDPKELISLYSIEKQTNQGYNGRQLLELFQNCEDEGASTVDILLDTQQNLLTISNDGPKPFSLKGYDSIFYPGLSSKVSSGYIGNKGLGFRSIINWADEISIISNDFKVIFNDAFKRETLITQLGYTEEELMILRKERKLNADIYPIPLLNCCKILDLDAPHSFTTTISIQYKKSFEGQIIEQLRSISLKTLLFLRNINSINIKGDVIQKSIAIERLKASNNDSEVTFNNERYYILSDDGIVDNDLIDDNESSEPKRYSVKIAYSDSLTFTDSVLYNYFKTQIPFNLPFVAHASLELDQNRNHSTESKVNPFILNKLFALHLRLIEVLKGKNIFSWLPFQSINKDNQNIYTPYMNIIEAKWGTLKIFPTFSGMYLNQDQAKTLGNNFAKFIEKEQLESKYGQQVISCDLEIRPERYIGKPSDFIKIIESLAKGLNFLSRAELIKLILNHYPNDKFRILIDEDNEDIDTQDFVYTDKTGESKGLKVPSYSNIRFLHPSLFQALITELGLQSETNKPRVLKDRLEKISDVHSFEPQTVIKKIISETNIVLNDFTRSKKVDIIEFYQILFHNYFSRSEQPKLDFEGRIPCLNQMDQIKDIKELVFSEEFEIGKISKSIFGKLYESDKILANLNILGLENKNNLELEQFFKWLGINCISIIEDNNSNIDWRYINYANRIYNTSVSGYQLFTIKHFDRCFVLTNKNINAIIGWLSLDERIKIIFNNFTSTHSSSEKLTYSYYGTRNILPFQNFIYYWLFTQCEFNNYLITNKKDEWFNPFKIDYDYLKSMNSQLDKNEVDRLLVFFGAKKDFNDLNIEYLSKKTKELADRNNPKGSQVFYKSLVGHYKQNEKKIVGANLYAKQGDKVLVKSAQQIYFSDRIQLPEALTNKFPILYYPSRSGGSTAIEMFGLKNLNDLDLKIINSTPNQFISIDFEKLLKEVRPFILAFRLDKITKEDVRRNQVQRLNKLRISCCSEIVCTIDNDSFDIEPYNYIFANDVFYINIPENVSLSELKQNKLFIDNLSDIFLKVFDTIDEKKIFESIVKQSKEDNIYDVNNELAEGILEEARILLGEVSIRLSIWRSIFNLKSIKDLKDLNDNNLEEYIQFNFPEIVKELLFDSDGSEDEIKKIRAVFITLGIDLIDYNRIAEHKVSFDKLFKTELKIHYSVKIKFFKNQLWDCMRKSNSIGEHIGFLKQLYLIERLLDNMELDKGSSTYDFDQIILDKLTNALPKVAWTMDSHDLPSYDQLEQECMDCFSLEDQMKIRRDEKLNSLSYFEGYIDYIKSELLEREKKDEAISPGVHLDPKGDSEFIYEFEIEVINNSSTVQSNGPWVGGVPDEHGNANNKILGNSVEEIVYRYLNKYPHLYRDVDKIAKTNEGAHYDVKYFDVVSQRPKYAECKYYNGISFLLSRDEKLFADNHKGEYEIWLVNKESKIYCIKDLTQLGDPQPVNYKINIKLKECSYKLNSEY